jgi:hypothetical protein
MVQERVDAEDPAKRRLRRKVRKVVVQQAQEMASVILPKQSRHIFERTHSASVSSCASEDIA